MIRELVKKAWHERATINIGKRGITEEVLEEIRRQLKKHKVVKVKILRNCPLRRNYERKEIPYIIASKVNAKVMGVRGYVFILARMRKLDSKLKA